MAFGLAWEEARTEETASLPFFRGRWASVIVSSLSVCRVLDEPLRNHHSVASLSLRPVQRIVRKVQDRSGRCTGVLACDCDCPNAHGKGNLAGICQEAACRHGMPQSLCPLLQSRRGTPIENDQEFFAAVSSDQIIGPHPAAEPAGESIG